MKTLYSVRVEVEAPNEENLETARNRVYGVDKKTPFYVTSDGDSTFIVFEWEDVDNAG